MLRPDDAPIDEEELLSMRNAFRPLRLDASAFSAFVASCDASLNFSVVGADSPGAGAGAAGGGVDFTLGAPRHIREVSN